MWGRYGCADRRPVWWGESIFCLARRVTGFPRGNAHVLNHKWLFHFFLCRITLDRGSSRKHVLPFFGSEVRFNGKTGQVSLETSKMRATASGDHFFVRKGARQGVGVLLSSSYNYFLFSITRPAKCTAPWRSSMFGHQVTELALIKMTESASGDSTSNWRKSYETFIFGRRIREINIILCRTILELGGSVLNQGLDN